METQKPNETEVIIGQKKKHSGWIMNAWKLVTGDVGQGFEGGVEGIYSGKWQQSEAL